MTKRFISLALAMLLILGLVPTAFASDSHVLYVATDGNDSAVGTETAPLKTFEGAVARVRELKAQGIKVTEVIFIHHSESITGKQRSAVLNVRSKRSTDRLANGIKHRRYHKIVF